MYFDEAICDNFMRPSRAIIRAQEAGLLYYHNLDKFRQT